jgi:hypothetical protein
MPSSVDHIRSRHTNGCDFISLTCAAKSYRATTYCGAGFGFGFEEGTGGGGLLAPAEDAPELAFTGVYGGGADTKDDDEGGGGGGAFLKALAADGVRPSVDSPGERLLP